MIIHPFSHAGWTANLSANLDTALCFPCSILYQIASLSLSFLFLTLILSLECGQRFLCFSAPAFFPFLPSCIPTLSALFLQRLLKKNASAKLPFLQKAARTLFVKRVLAAEGTIFRTAPRSQLPPEPGRRLPFLISQMQYCGTLPLKYL